MPSFTTLAGLKEESEAAYVSLAKITSKTQSVGLCSVEDFSIPSIWHCSAKFLVSQMICYKLADCRDYQMETLTKADVPEMKALVMQTQPGPFFDRTIEFGNFLGIKHDSKLVAMAGQRMKIPGYDEVSAVCTHPDYQGKGYARALVHAISRRIIEGGNIPFLHVRSENPAGIRSYESVGFKTRRELYFAVLRRS